MQSTPIVLNFASVDVKYALMSVGSLGATPWAAKINHSDPLHAESKAAVNFTKHITVTYRPALL